MSELLKGIIPIEKKFLQSNDLFALEFREGFVFGRIIKRRIMQHYQWNLIDSDGTEIDIPAASTPTQGEQRFNDPRAPANSLLYLNASTIGGWPVILHGAFGVKPQYIQMFLHYPEGKEIPGKFPNITPIRPAMGDQITPLNGLSSPYEQPTDFIEVVIQPKIHLGCEYYNHDEKRNHLPVVNILFCLYQFQILKKNTHPILISDIAMKRYSGEHAAFLTVGFGDHAHDLGGDLLNEWKATPMSLDDAVGLGGRT